ncbi:MULTISPECIES: hypothetical protein [Ralstonia solanacearum species complex]|uniref:Transmembrane protein n=4 Tax=Ralstonia solanacearum species complex TaxID=3116862 RepID=A0A0K1ZK05_RALSL|nr:MULTISPECIES: hypothetical protein [Ralstonia]AKZ26293.1 hypothetical protein ACH51_08005 [Ralstonia solanacearum]APC68613.1 hypothetical protein RSOE_16490 [Ralstonia solanacearum OE1-1]APF86988.1 hypothetical protein BCR16_09295 [Ralstonia solanacearum FJAT-1458]ARS56239.1 hypothetical protein BC427_09075 [Ralstonia solanacearum FJAT-91]ESS50017.1 hypothetical protein L665_01342 [Ralstonia solanacearum SD54]
MTIFDENEHREQFWAAVRDAIALREQSARAHRTERLVGAAIGLSIAALGLALLVWRRHTRGDAD